MCLISDLHGYDLDIDQDQMCSDLRNRVHCQIVSYVHTHKNLFAGGIINTEKSEGIASPGDIGKGKKSDKEAKALYERLLGDSKRSFVGSSSIKEKNNFLLKYCNPQFRNQKI